ncbi:hypothetical protein GGX14DRAFT_408666 [Mycena pura]|uniref:Uncharacterized protein n=1 Tax=Mycena pura TaxID=153505 RepID=A0AAD6UPQ1_9AGAR|nr:hypothetical protein GGX14DRAFT_408666 [Mycena pura]
MTTEPRLYATRAVTRAGLVPAPRSPRDTPRPPSSPSSPAGADSGDAGTPKSRPVTPELLYSNVVAGSLDSSEERGDSLARSAGQGVQVGSTNSSVSDVPLLTRDVDFGTRELLDDSAAGHGRPGSCSSGPDARGQGEPG